MDLDSRAFRRLQWGGEASRPEKATLAATGQRPAARASSAMMERREEPTMRSSVGPALRAPGRCLRDTVFVVERVVLRRVSGYGAL